MWTPPCYQQSNNSPQVMTDINSQYKFFKKLRKELREELGLEDIKKKELEKKKKEEVTKSSFSRGEWSMIFMILSPFVMIGTSWAWLLMMASYMKALKDILP